MAVKTLISIPASSHFQINFPLLEINPLILPLCAFILPVAQDIMCV
jgi:hypothetical protein